MDNHKVRVGHQSRAAQQPEPKTGFIGFIFFFMHLFCLSSLMAADLDGSVTLHGGHYCQKSLSYHAVAYKKGANYKCMGGLSGGLGKKKKAINTDL